MNKNLMVMFVGSLLISCGCGINSSSRDSAPSGSFSLNELSLLQEVFVQFPDLEIGSSVAFTSGGGYVNLWHDDVAKFILIHGDLGLLRGLCDTRDLSYFYDGIPVDFPPAFSESSNAGSVRICDVFYYVGKRQLEDVYEIFSVDSSVAERDHLILQMIKSLLQRTAGEVPDRSNVEFKHPNP